MFEITDNTVDFFLNNVDIRGKDDCWIWRGYTDKNGYGMMTVSENGKIVTRGTHRISFEIYNSPITKGLFVCHTCDNPPCVNPNHLWLGTHKQNMEDKVKKGRHIVGKQKVGEEMPNHKLTEKQVIEIINIYQKGKNTLRKLAKDFGVCYSTIWKIMNGKKWKYLLSGPHNNL